MTHPLFDIKEWGRWDGYGGKWMVSAQNDSVAKGAWCVALG